MSTLLVNDLISNIDDAEMLICPPRLQPESKPSYSLILDIEDTLVSLVHIERLPWPEHKQDFIDDIELVFVRLGEIYAYGPNHLSVSNIKAMIDQFAETRERAEHMTRNMTTHKVIFNRILLTFINSFLTEVIAKGADVSDVYNAGKMLHESVVKQLASLNNKGRLDSYTDILLQYYTMAIDKGIAANDKFSDI